MMPSRPRPRIALLALSLLLAGPVAAQPSLPEVTPEAFQQGKSVRVLLFGRLNPEAVTIRVAQERELRLFTEGTALFRLQAGDEVTVKRRNNELHIQAPSGELFVRSLRLAPVAPSGQAAWHLKITKAGGRRRSKQRSYAGTLRIGPAPSKRRALQLINVIDLEAYVASVVASEYGLGDLEGSKAMAVAVRTYAVRRSPRARGAYDHVDHVGSQVYRGAAPVTPVSLRAATATRGQIATYNGKPITALYYSSSGGHTADNDAVWNTAAIPYLRGRPDPYDYASPHTQWRKALNRTTLLNHLSDRYGFDVRGLRIASHSSDGRARAIKLLGKNGKSRVILGDVFRRFVTRRIGGTGLPSTMFEIQRTGDQYVFTGSGFGHGIGMSQYGAHAMGEAGKGYREILSFYYRSIDLARIDSSPSPPAAAPALAKVKPLTAQPAAPEVKTPSLPLSVAPASQKSALQKRAGIAEKADARSGW